MNGLPGNAGRGPVGAGGGLGGLNLPGGGRPGGLDRGQAGNPRGAPGIHLSGSFSWLASQMCLYGDMLS